ncbi:MAG: FAD-dependent monooxygenase [Microcoleaceae cyanobacterium]
MTSLPTSSSNRRHAVVMGASMAGLLAGRILLNHFDRVTIVERDRLRESSEPRRGVPQGTQVHILLARGQQILEQLFPGLIADIAAAGGPKVNWTAECPVYSVKGWLPRFVSDVVTYTCSRCFLELKIRQRLQQFDRLQFIDQSSVSELVTNPDCSEITGVKVRHLKTDETETLQTQLVVDATGRNSNVPKWLTQLGYEAPEETVINAFLGYGSRWYQQPDDLKVDWKALLIENLAPNQGRGGILYPVEGNRWIVTLSGVGRDYPPTDEAGFLEFAQSLRHRMIYDVIKNAQPLSPIHPYRRTENRLYHYEKLTQLPQGLVMLGDAVCAFNPVYGQGMTTAALGALTLDECLQSQKQQTKLTQTFQKKLFKVIQNPWLMATGEDIRWPATEGGKTDWMTQLNQGYFSQMMLIMKDNPELCQTFVEVVNMLKPPTAFFHPKYMVQVLASLLNNQSNMTESMPDSTVPQLSS